MKFMVLSRDEIRHFQIEEKHIVISIRDPNSKRARLPKLYSRLAILDLEFSDLDEHLPSESFYILFTKEDAKKILNFYNKYKDKIEIVVCQCEAGISRSAGVAAALSKIYNEEDEIYFKRFIPNKRVYRTILEEYYK